MCKVLIKVEEAPTYAVGSCHLCHTFSGQRSNLWSSFTSLPWCMDKGVVFGRAVLCRLINTGSVIYALELEYEP